MTNHPATLPPLSGCDAVAALPRRERRRPGRWISGAVLLIILGFVVHAFVTGQIEWSAVGRYFTASTILAGLQNTVLISVLSMALAIVIGILVAIMRMSSNPVARWTGGLYVWIFRGTPIYLQLLLWFNLALVFPTVTIPLLYHGRMVHLMTPFLAALLGLSIYQGAYTSELVRSGVLAVDQGQREAGQSIGMTHAMLMRRVIFPQAMRVIIPPLGNEFIGLIKTSSLAAIISYQEIMDRAQVIYSQNNRVIELLIVCALWYLIVVSVLSIGQMLVERRFGKGYRTGRAQRVKPRRMKAQTLSASVPEEV